jgi:hypothetical protein
MFRLFLNFNLQFKFVFFNISFLIWFYFTFSKLYNSFITFFIVERFFLLWNFNTFAQIKCDDWCGLTKRKSFIAKRQTPSILPLFYIIYISNEYQLSWVRVKEDDVNKEEKAKEMVSWSDGMFAWRIFFSFSMFFFFAYQKLIPPSIQFEHGDKDY